LHGFWKETAGPVASIELTANYWRGVWVIGTGDVNEEVREF